MEVFGVIALVMVLMFAVAAALAFKVICRRKNDTRQRMAEARIVHDLNNMLGAIHAASECLAGVLEDDDKLKKYAEIIVKSSERAVDLLEGYTGSMQKHTVTDIHQCIDETLFLLEHRIGEGVSIRKEITAENFFVKIDDAAVQSLLLNLGLNACEAMPDGGIISVATRNVNLDEDNDCILKVPAGEYLEIRFADTGKGMPKSVQDKIFEPFFTTKKAKKRTGIGLSSVLETIVQSCGTLKFDTSSSGTVFYIYFPIAENGDGKFEAEKKASDLKSKIMLVDDEPVLLELMKDILTGAGSEVIAVSDSQKAVEVFEKNSDVEVVMLDVVMPNFDGIELYWKFRGMNPKLKIVFLSGYSKDERVSGIVAEDKLTGFMAKPYKPADVVEKLAILLAKE